MDIVKRFSKIILILFISSFSIANLSEAGLETSMDVAIIVVESLLPNEGTEIDDEDGDDNTKTFVVAKADTGTITVTATPNPNVAEADLPLEWKLTGGTGTGDLTRTVDKTTPDETLITCICGSSYKKTTIIVVEVEYFKEGTTNSISEIHIGTDSDQATSYGGETGKFDVKITPNNVTLDFDLENNSNQITFSPTSGYGTTTITIVGHTGDGSNDARFHVVDPKDNVISSFPIKVHKPKKLEFAVVYDLPLPPDEYGDFEERHYNVYDFQNRLTDIRGYFSEEYITMIENDDGLGGSYPPIDAGSGPNLNSDLVDQLSFIFTGTLEPGHKYKWNQKLQILGLDLENNLWKHDFRRIDATHLEIDSFSGQW
ncbi:MAG: hypothetical protein KAQ99_01335 [Candidatus Aureabacteria bacterium]|nr:hypothetical protein [Candidatus Auribacterota bacterium]MCK5160192.1 hypothetical protein [Candidatus Auribacterota bacterium]